MRRLFLVALLLIIGADPAMSFRIVNPWPDPATAHNVREERITFQSSDPFAPSDIGSAPARSVTGLLFLPADARPKRGIPAVVMLHGSAGMISDRAKYGPQLAAMGIAVLLVETYDSRRDLATSFIDRVLHITETMFVADAYAALHYLANRPEIDGRRVALAGFSYGGMATEYAMYAQMAEALSPDGLRFVGHVAFYAPCIARFADSRTTGAPLLMLYGADDELMRPERCEAGRERSARGRQPRRDHLLSWRCPPMGRRDAARRDRTTARRVSLFGVPRRHGARPEHRPADVGAVPAQDHSGALHRQPTLSDRPRRCGASRVEPRLRQVPGSRFRRVDFAVDAPCWALAQDCRILGSAR